MKKLLFVLALTLTFASCQKENIQPNPVEVVEIEESGIDLYGEWVLLDGQMFIENMETGGVAQNRIFLILITGKCYGCHSDLLEGP